jgi:hypothetical protein
MKQNETVAYLNLLIAEVRNDHPTMSCRAMYYKIQPEKLGRDKFEQLCYEWGYMSEQQVKVIRTTDSTGVIRFENLLTDFTLTDINQAYSSDITYFEVLGTYYYLTFIIDCYSRRILGHVASKKLTTEQTTLPALQMAIKTRNYSIPEGIIFHSDGGGQYYDKAFLALTKQYHFRNSMCEMAYENGRAERVNGIIKNNYLVHYPIKTFEQLEKMLDRSVALYNQEKPHKALHYKTPLYFENNLLLLHKQNDPRMKESFYGNIQIDGASSPIQSEQNNPQNQDVFIGNTKRDKRTKTVNVF